VKKFLSAEAQGSTGALPVICINGGMVTQVEQEEMPRILSEAAGDAQKSGVSLRYSSKHLHTSRCLCGSTMPADLILPGCLGLQCAQ
jgi:hypothetical protein